jgi:hypothetical protein
MFHRIKLIDSNCGNTLCDRTFKWVYFPFIEKKRLRLHCARRVKFNSPFCNFNLDLSFRETRNECWIFPSVTVCFTPEWLLITLTSIAVSYALPLSPIILSAFMSLSKAPSVDTLLIINSSTASSIAS